MKECGNTWGWWPLESMQSWVYTLVHRATEACCYRSKGRFYKGTLHTYTLKNCSLNVLLRDWLTAALSIHPFLHCLSIIISLSVSLFLLFTLFSGCRCLILCIKNSLRFLIVEYFMPFNFSWALTVTLTSVPPFLSLPFYFSPLTQQIFAVSVVTFSLWRYSALLL